MNLKSLTLLFLLLSTKVYSQFNDVSIIKFLQKVNKDEYNITSLPSFLKNPNDRSILEFGIENSVNEKYFKNVGLGIQDYDSNNSIDIINFYPKEIKFKIENIIKPNLTVGEIFNKETSITLYESNSLLYFDLYRHPSSISESKICNCEYLILTYEVTVDKKEQELLNSIKMRKTSDQLRGNGLLFDNEQFKKIMLPSLAKKVINKLVFTIERAPQGLEEMND